MLESHFFITKVTSEHAVILNIQNGGAWEIKRQKQYNLIHCTIRRGAWGKASINFCLTASLSLQNPLYLLVNWKANLTLGQESFAIKGTLTHATL